MTIRTEDKPCHCKDPEGLVCFECDDYAQAIERARQRGQVDSDGNPRVGIADFQPVLNVGQTLNFTDESK